MSDIPGLTFAAEPDAPATFNVLLYGPPGCGKSTAAATAPGPILWLNAEGAGALSYARKTARERGTQILEVRVEETDNMQDVLREFLRYAKTGAEPAPQTVVIDTLGKVRDGLIRRIVKQGSKDSLRQFGEVSRIIGETVRVLRDLPVNVVLLAHESVEDADGGDRIVRPMIGGQQTELIPGEVDVMAYCGVRITDEGDREYLGQLVEMRGRRAKDRSGGLGDYRPLDVSEWLAEYRRTLGPTDVPWADGDGDPDVPNEDALFDEPSQTAASSAYPEDS